MKERLKKAFYHLKSIGLVSTQEDIAIKMGFSRTSISKAMNGYEEYLTESFMTKLNNAYPDIFNLDWLLNGDGLMLKSGYSNYTPENIASENIQNYGVTRIVEPEKTVPYYLYFEVKEENKQLLKEVARLEMLLEQHGINPTKIVS